MPILQYQCRACTSLFEHFASIGNDDAACLSCGSEKIARVFETSYYPNKTFCPHDKEIELNDAMLSNLGEILKSDELRCGGCGVDGPKGSCGTTDKKSGSCGNCSCGKGGCGS